MYIVFFSHFSRPEPPGTKKTLNGPQYVSTKKKSGGQQEEGHGVDHHVQ